MSVSITLLLALVCVIVGLIGEVIDERLLLGTLEWFILALVFNTLEATYTIGKRSPD
jgi:hypothetical protein